MPPGGQILQILMAQNLYFTKLYNIPEMINHVGSAKKAQSTFEILGKMTQNWPFFSFFGTIPKKSKLLYFLNAYGCIDLEQEESKKVRSI